MVHLHVHSEYSLLEASSGVKDLVAKAQKLGMKSLALTDLGNMFGAIEFYFACQEKSIRPILGLEVYMAPGSRFEKQSNQDRDSMMKGPGRLVLLAQNLEGYRNLCRISTSGFQEGFYYKPRVDLEILQKYSQSLICLTGGVRSDVLLKLQKEGEAAAREYLVRLQKIFGERLYLEVQRDRGPLPTEPFLKNCGQELGIPLVATSEVFYLEPEDEIAQEVLVCIGSNRTLADESRPKLPHRNLYLRSPEEMELLFQDHPEWIANSDRIAESVQLKFRLKDESGKAIYHLPSFPTREGRSLAEEIRALAEEGLLKRWQQATARGESPGPELQDQSRQRLAYELSIIDRMGFNGYFLIVADFINWAKAQGIPVGPGRGSGAGSLVAFCLGITDLDPMPYKLLFERFLNPERISMPDFDIDFCQELRSRVIDYVTQKYGPGSVSQIITYGKLQCRAALKDVGRVLGMSFQEVDQVTKLVPEKLNITIEEALKEEPKLRELMETNPQVQTLVELALKVEGLVRHAGIHAAGVIIADGELVQHAPLYRGSDGENVVQYDMKHAEKIGLIKFDFLGLKTLTLIQRALELIEKNQAKKIRTEEISLSDAGIYQLMSSGDTAGVFQFEGDGITEAIRKIRPTTFFDITAINALYRPGPMAMIPDFAKRKHGEAPVEYLFPELKEVLEETYGIIVYQEQVMGIASRIAGYSLGEADMLRRAMGKKIKEEMDQHRVRFLKGAKERGFDEKKSEELFELMYKFADYGFNKSHAAAYCVVAAHTAWLKNYYPSEFFAALLSTELGNTDNVVRYIKDAQKHGIDVKPPHVNVSDFLFTVSGRDIYFGLGAIKGVGESAIQAILKAREEKESRKFASLEDFFESVDTKKLNKKLIEALIKAGALDGFGWSRAELMHNFPKLMDYAAERRRDREVGQVSLFDMEGPSLGPSIELERVAAWPRSLELSYEKEVLGFYLSDHPLKGFERIVATWTTCNVQGLQKLSDSNSETEALANSNPMAQGRYPKHQKKRRVVLAGLLNGIREVITKKGTRMAFGALEDLSGQVELIFFPDVFAEVSGLFQTDQPVLVGGSLETSDTGSFKIIVDSLIPLQKALHKIRSLRIQLKGLSEDQTRVLVKVLKSFPGPTKLDFSLSLDDLGQQIFFQSEELPGVDLGGALFEDLRQVTGQLDFLEVR